MFYAGIGSRSTPTEVLLFFEKVGEFLAKQNFILRTGGAKGADTAFENGCDRASGIKEIYLPWKGFEGSFSNLIVKKEEAFEIASKFHPAWNRLSQGAKKLQARNSHQILGEDLMTPSGFVVCYTKNGKRSGGTGQALRLAEYYNIPIFDAGLYKNMKEIRLAFKQFLIENTSLKEEDIKK